MTDPMTATEAMTYCLGFVDESPTDGEYQSRTVYDVYGAPHWIAWRAAHGKDASPMLHSGSPTPFAENLEPYRTHV